jgi:hypothetical protein
MSLVRKLFNVFRRARLDRDLEDELEFHRQMRLRKALDQGLSLTSAEEVAKRRMGNLTLAREEMGDARVIGWLASSLQDLRHGAVLLKRDTGLSVLMILVLAIGIGGSATMFTLGWSATYGHAASEQRLFRKCICVRSGSRGPISTWLFAQQFLPISL